jgi:hypothetical protein
VLPPGIRHRTRLTSPVAPPGSNDLRIAAVDEAGEAVAVVGRAGIVAIGIGAAI